MNSTMYRKKMFLTVFTFLLSTVHVVHGTGDEHMSNMTVPFNGTALLPTMICWKVPLYEKCPDCSSNETPFRCFVRGVLPMVLLVGVLLIPVILCCYYRAVANMIHKYQVSLVHAFKDETNMGYKRIYEHSAVDPYNKDRAGKAFDI